MPDGLHVLDRWLIYLSLRYKRVTFNYDNSLESAISESLFSLDLFDEGNIRKFLIESRVSHIYGSVHESIPGKNDIINLKSAASISDRFNKAVGFESQFWHKKDFLDTCWAAAQRIRTIDPHDKEENAAAIEQSRQWMSEADVVYILGYGFDFNNNHRSGLSELMELFEGTNRRVMFTNYGDINIINKRASKLFFVTSSDRFIGQSVYGDAEKGSYVEKSVRTVYEALERDFDALEVM